MVFMPTAISRKLLLRLDDGSIVGPSLRFRSSANGQEFVRLSAPEALNLGRLTQLHLTFAQKLVQELHSKVPDAEPLPSLSGGSGALKRKTPDTLEVHRALLESYICVSCATTIGVLPSYARADLLDKPAVQREHQ